MVKLASFAVSAIAVSTVSAIDIKFRRFSRRGCREGTEHIAADTHLHDPHCKSFDTDEPAFYSFNIEHEDNGDDLKNKYCYAVIYDGQDCTGKAFTYGDMSDYIGKCANSTLPGRSVRISCDDTFTTRTREYTGTPTATLDIETPVLTATEIPVTTATEVTHVEQPATTVTLVALTPTHHHHEDFYDGDHDNDEDYHEPYDHDDDPDRCDDDGDYVQLHRAGQLGDRGDHTDPHTVCPFISEYERCLYCGFC